MGPPKNDRLCSAKPQVCNATIDCGIPGTETGWVQRPQKKTQRLSKIPRQQQPSLTQMLLATEPCEAAHTREASPVYTAA